MSELEGTMLGDYFLTQCVRQGETADVYRGQRKGLASGEMAIKIFHASYTRKPAFREQFINELEKVSRFEHPSILPVMEYGEDNDILYTVAPFVYDGTLGDFLRTAGRRLTPQQVVLVVQQICEAVHYAHEHNVIHGNIKPTNIFLLPQGSVALADFGLAYGYDDGRSALPRVGWGAAGFLSPE